MNLWIFIWFIFIFFLLRIDCLRIFIISEEKK